MKSLKKHIRVNPLLGIPAIVFCIMSMLFPLAAAAADSDEEPVVAAAADSNEELAKKLANPIASLISVPLQYNFDNHYGPNDEGYVHRLTIQPVIPFALNDNWNIITRTIVPLLSQHDVPIRGMNDSGLGDITASQFFSPKQPTAGGWIWGVGLVELLPTASHATLGGEQWGLGPTGVLLRQSGPWTVGLLANHIWSFGVNDRASISATFVQPFVSYIFTKTKTTVGVNTESTYDWQDSQWSVPVIAQVSQLLKIGPLIFQLSLGAKYWAFSPDDGPENWGLRAQLTFLFPKK